MDFFLHRYTVNIGGGDIDDVFPFRRYTPEGDKEMKVYDIEIEFQAVRSGGRDVWAFSHIMISGTRRTFWKRNKEAWSYLADTHRLPPSLWDLVSAVSATIPDAVPSPFPALSD